jgi:putative ABC transport system ATP-binding protein
VLKICDLSRSFHEGSRVRCVLDRVNAQVAAGEMVALVGRSGSGKSTLLNLISGIDRADGGYIEFDGRRVSALGEPERTLFRRRHVGFVYQLFNLLPTLDVEENVRLVLELNGVHGRRARAKSETLLAEVGLGERLHSSVDVLSGGEQQRVAIARALVHEPALLLADEPTGNLDQQSARELLPLLRELAQRRRAALVIATHDPALARDADRTLELIDGRLAPPSLRGARP